MSSIIIKMITKSLGIKYASIIPLPIPKVIKSINESVLPEDRSRILDYVEMLDINLTDPKARESNMNQFRDSNGMMFLIRLMKKMIDDPILIQVSMAVLEAVKANKSLVMDFIQYGGLDVLHKVMTLHEKDEFIRLSVPSYVHFIVGVGRKLSIKEIREEAMNLQLCHKCSELIERARRPKFGSQAFKVPRSHDRINKVFKLAENYLKMEDVLTAALDAALIFCNNPDAPATTLDTMVVMMMGKILKEHTKVPELVWRACMVLSILGKMHADIALSIMRIDVQTLLANNFKHFAEHQVVQQQILWYFSMMLGWGRTYKALHENAKVVDFFCKLPEEFDPVLAAAVAATHADDHEPYGLIIPLNIRMFVRVTGGVVSMGDKREERNAAGGAEKPQRRNFDEKPKFGTVSLEGGESGLV